MAVSHQRAGAPELRGRSAQLMSILRACAVAGLVLVSGTVTPASLAAAADTTFTCADGTEVSEAAESPFKARMDAAIAYLARPEHLGRPLAVDDRLYVCPGVSATDPGHAAETIARYDASGNLTRCQTVIYAEGVTVAADPRIADSMLTHEVFHCFMWARLTKAEHDRVPAWVDEGAAAWVGEERAGGSAYSANWWRFYLTEPRDALSSRGYTGIGLFAHMAEVGIDPYRHMDKLFASAVAPFGGMTGSESAFFTAIADNRTAYLDTLPTGLARNPAFGKAWDMAGPGITADRYEPPELLLNQTLEVAEGASDLRSLSLPSDEVIHVRGQPEGSLNGRLRDAAGAEYSLVTADYCSRAGGCACPGESGDPALAAIAPGPALLALTGHVRDQAVADVGSQVRVTAMDVGAFCAGRAAPDPSVSPPASVAAGVDLTFDGSIAGHATSARRVDPGICEAATIDMPQVSGDLDNLQIELRPASVFGISYLAVQISGGGEYLLGLLIDGYSGPGSYTLSGDVSATEFVLETADRSLVLAGQIGSSLTVDPGERSGSINAAFMVIGDASTAVGLKGTWTCQ